MSHFLLIIRPARPGPARPGPTGTHPGPRVVDRPAIHFGQNGPFLFPALYSLARESGSAIPNTFCLRESTPPAGLAAELACHVATAAATEPPPTIDKPAVRDHDSQRSVTVTAGLQVDISRPTVTEQLSSGLCKISIPSVNHERYTCLVDSKIICLGRLVSVTARRPAVAAAGGRRGRRTPAQAAPGCTDSERAQNVRWFNLNAGGIALPRGRLLVGCQCGTGTVSRDLLPMAQLSQSAPTSALRRARAAEQDSERLPPGLQLPPGPGDSLHHGDPSHCIICHCHWQCQCIIQHCIVSYNHDNHIIISHSIVSYDIV
jgi:hypothetical protein